MSKWLAVDVCSTPLGELRVAATERGLVRMSFERSTQAYAEWLSRRLPDHASTRTVPPLEQARVELAEYFARKRQSFKVPLELFGTPFQCTVWHALQEIPYGTTWTYRELAQHLGRPRALRAVGAANGMNPIPIVVPCHRVVAAGGKLGGYSGGLDIKRKLLALESDLELRSPASGAGRPLRKEAERRSGDPKRDQRITRG